MQLGIDALFFLILRLALFFTQFLPHGTHIHIHSEKETHTAVAAAGVAGFNFNGSFRGGEKAL